MQLKGSSGVTGCNHSPELLRELLALKQRMWREHRRKVNGLPASVADSKSSVRGSTCGVVLDRSSAPHRRPGRSGRRRMFQAEVKLEFVRRYCSPAAGWCVFVDIDPSEEGRTGGERKATTARASQVQMRRAAERVRSSFAELGVTVGGARKKWFAKYSLPRVDGDRDIVAFQPTRRRYLIAEAEGVSSGQAEQKLYKAIGQIVVAASVAPFDGWRRQLVLVVHRDEITEHLSRATALERLGVAAVSIAEHPQMDRWIIGARPAA